MTKIQIKFLECIYKKDMSAKEICKKLKIKANKNNIQGGCYNALNRKINFIQDDDGNEIDNMFKIDHDKNSGYPDNDDIYIITKEGRKYLEDYWERNTNKTINIITLMVSTITLIVSIVSVIISII